MGLFSRNYNKPGPGIPKDLPRKKGTARFFELLLRDFSDLVKLSLLFSLSALLSVAAFIIGALPYMMGFFELNLIFLLLSLVFAYPVGGALVACYFNITRLMRDDASYVWHDFKRKFKENHRQAAPVGIVCTAFIYIQVLLWFQMYYQMVAGTYTGGLLWIILSLLSFLLFFMITPFIFLHYAYIDLGTFQILKNSLLMSFMHLPRSFMGALCGSMIWLAMALFMPSSMLIAPLVPLILLSVSMLLALSWIWPKFEKYFNIEETLKRLRDDKEKDASEGEASVNVFDD